MKRAFTKPALVLTALVAPALAAARDEPTLNFPEHGLSLRLSALEELVVERPAGRDVLTRWSGLLAGHPLEGALELLRPDEVPWSEPGDVVEALVREARREGDFEVQTVWFPRGPYGCAPFACALRAAASVLLPPEPDVPGEPHWALAGLLPAGEGYALRLTSPEPPPEEVEAAFRGFLETAVAYDGPLRDPRWSVEEIRERWLRDAPEELHEDFLAALERPGTFGKHVIRTDHYIVLTDGSGGNLFARKLEENYRTIARLFPFDEIEGRRLMPIFCFTTPGRYRAFQERVLRVSPEVAAASRGLAARDYYATYYGSPNDPVHLHEQTHQIFENRLRLNHGGSWFQEGVAQYASTRPNDRNVVARAVRDGEATPLRSLVQLPNLLYSAPDESESRGGAAVFARYLQAALLIEFLREGPWRERFSQFLHTLGWVPRNHAPKIDAAFRRVYGVGIDGVEAAWREYCESR